MSYPAANLRFIKCESHKKKSKRPSVRFPFDSTGSVSKTCFPTDQSVAVIGVGTSVFFRFDLCCCSPSNQTSAKNPVFPRKVRFISLLICRYLRATGEENRSDRSLATQVSLQLLKKKKNVAPEASRCSSAGGGEHLPVGRDIVAPRFI